MKQIAIPGSKSITNRVLLLAAIGDSPVILHNMLESDDTVHMRSALAAFGVRFEPQGASLKVIPPAQLIGDGESHFIGNAGTVARFVSAASLIIHGRYGLNGVERMHERPQADLLSALRSLGVVVDCHGTDGFLPATYVGLGGALLAQRSVSLSGRVSSQFITALLLIAPRIKGGLRIEMDEIPPSQPYIKMTLAILKHWQVSYAIEDQGRIMDIQEGLKAPTQYTIPADMSAASYPCSWATLNQQPLTIKDYGSVTLQGDEEFTSVCAHFGATVTKIHEDCILDQFKAPQRVTCFDFSPMPDVAMTGMVMACFYEGRWGFEGLESLRVKECDRIQAMIDGFALLGIETQVVNNDVTIRGGGYWQTDKNIAKVQSAAIETQSHDDHRIAMCFGILRSALARNTGQPSESLFTIGEPHCVAKTWPTFWADLALWEA